MRRKRGSCQGVDQEPALTTREVVDPGHITPLCKESIHDITADEPGTSGYDEHGYPRSLNTKYFIMKKLVDAVPNADATTPK